MFVEAPRASTGFVDFLYAAIKKIHNWQIAPLCELKRINEKHAVGMERL